MTMYLPNRDVLPTGNEPAEFLDAPTFVPPAEPSPGSPEDPGEEGEASGS
jgi:hypothetical protein